MALAERNHLFAVVLSAALVIAASVGVAWAADEHDGSGRDSPPQQGQPYGNGVITPPREPPENPSQPVEPPAHILEEIEELERALGR
ncbi:hypothetical protein ACFLXE_07775 [Chloroflexota bacterium]